MVGWMLVASVKPIVVSSSLLHLTLVAPSAEKETGNLDLDHLELHFIARKVSKSFCCTAVLKYAKSTR
jgi:hypothetical protein